MIANTVRNNYLAKIILINYNRSHIKTTNHYEEGVLDDYAMTLMLSFDLLLFTSKVTTLLTITLTINN